MSEYGKTVKLSNLTLDLIELYRKGIIDNADKDSLKSYFEELSYDKIIRMALCDKLVVIRDRS